MKLLGIDIGSSSIKAAILRSGRVSGRIARVGFPTLASGSRVEVDPRAVLKALAQSIRELGKTTRTVDCISLSVMAPSWVAMDHTGKPLTPIVTHQDRRSVDAALDLEKRVGRKRHLKLAGNRPFPGGISSSTYAWFNRQAPEVMKKADLVGHLNTFLHRHLTHSRVTDPSNAAFMGLFNWRQQTSWNDELIDAVGASEHCLPQVVAADAVAGFITVQASALLGLMHGTPMVAGCLDACAAMLATGARPGQLLNVCGTTDVLALCTSKPTPHEKLMTFPLGTDHRWISCSTIAASGSALGWAKQVLFADLSQPAFLKLAARLAGEGGVPGLSFEPYLAGQRDSIEQRQAEFRGLTLGTTRQQMLAAMIHALANASAARIPLLKLSNGTRILPTVAFTGGVHDGLNKVLHRDWPKSWKYKAIPEATLLGLAALVPD